ncbi:MAG: hypothetical protein IT560_02895 [Alphaproteobacteria bacterium]|nr:hypothetical protein [Alphaproteobacteria bacterium]
MKILYVTFIAVILLLVSFFSDFAIAGDDWAQQFRPLSAKPQKGDFNVARVYPEGCALIEDRIKPAKDFATWAANVNAVMAQLGAGFVNQHDIFSAEISYVFVRDKNSKTPPDLDAIQRDVARSLAKPQKQALRQRYQLRYPGKDFKDRVVYSDGKIFYKLILEDPYWAKKFWATSDISKPPYYLDEAVRTQGYTYSKTDIRYLSWFRYAYDLKQGQSLLEKLFDFSYRYMSIDVSFYFTQNDKGDFENFTLEEARCGYPEWVWNEVAAPSGEKLKDLKFAECRKISERDDICNGGAEKKFRWRHEENLCGIYNSECPENVESLEKWYLDRAQRGERFYQQVLVRFYSDGKNRPIDSRKAYFWMLVQDNSGFGPSSFFGQMENSVSRDVKAQVRAEAKLWQPSQNMIQP